MRVVLLSALLWLAILLILTTVDFFPRLDPGSARLEGIAPAAPNHAAC